MDRYESLREQYGESMAYLEVMRNAGRLIDVIHGDSGEFVESFMDMDWAETVVDGLTRYADGRYVSGIIKMIENNMDILERHLAEERVTILGVSQDRVNLLRRLRVLR